MIETPSEFVDGMRTEGISDFGSIESNSHGPVFSRTVVGDVGEGLEPRNVIPLVGVEDLGNHGGDITRWLRRELAVVRRFLRARCFSLVMERLHEAPKPPRARDHSS